MSNMIKKTVSNVYSAKITTDILKTTLEVSDELAIAVRKAKNNIVYKKGLSTEEKLVLLEQLVEEILEHTKEQNTQYLKEAREVLAVYITEAITAGDIDEEGNVLDASITPIKRVLH